MRSGNTKTIVYFERWVAPIAPELEDVFLSMISQEEREAVKS